MGLETFPDIESFQKLPRQVIVKGGRSTYSQVEGAELRGIVINNIGHPIREIRVNAVIFNERKIPRFSVSTLAEPAALPQGGIAAFVFRLKGYPQPVSDYHLYVDWKFDEG